MIIQKKVTETKNYLQTVDIMCNRCGYSCKGSIGNYNGLIEVKVQGSYDSPVFVDGTDYIFSICEGCLLTYFQTFKHQPQIREMYATHLLSEDDAKEI